ncbi:iron dicitrate transport regulator FecR [Pedobacter sp. HMWF019]|uniref:FecR family protein n=1 Tax=Pedobacter sp. HMWF019 TaxID=2056856 RepID=UPI000D367B54|nr:FecR family protein [Pedobacter sp. HMWF019]PTS99978.1 iron dicitrate transport regulator FecR [Pedobacter sp. HMWF019]
MAKKITHYFDYLTDKNNEPTISSAEKKLLDDFMQQEYSGSKWDAREMGSKADISTHIYKNIQRGTLVKAAFKSYYKYAIAAVLTFILGLGILFRSPHQQPKELLMRTASVTDSIKLTDGTLVYLAAHSIFRYPEHFNGKIRSVELLKGNAFFKVAKDPSHPFIITSPQIKTKVLGTSFHISLDHNKSTVTVVTGHVSVYTKKQKTFLRPNEYAIFTSADGLKKQRTDDMSLYSWYKKDIELNQVSLDKVFTLLGFKYGVCFTTENEKILNTRITLYIKDGLPLQNILDQINYITHLKLRPYGERINVSN